MSTAFTFQQFVYLVTFKAGLRKKNLFFDLTEDYLFHHLYQKNFMAVGTATHLVVLIWDHYLQV